MKKALIASTALVMTAGIAAADVTISGYGRTAVDYQEGRDVESQIETRVRMNLDASTSTDSGVDFGARIRLQYDDGSSNSNISPAYLYVTASGLKVSVGNVDTAYDGAALMYESEVGLISRSFGVSRDYGFYSFSTGGYGDDSVNFDCVDAGGTFADCTTEGSRNRMGVAVQYTFGDLVAKASYVDPNQTVGGSTEEFSVSFAYKWNDLQLSAAAAKDAAGRADNDRYFVGAYYTMPGTSNGVGLGYTDDGIDTDGVDNGKIWVLYGDYEVAPMTTLSAYVSNNDKAGNETDNAFGIGAKYDLGGGILAGSIERGYDENIRADMGVKFDF